MSTPLTSSDIERIKRKAKSLSKLKKIKRTLALEIVSKELGYSSWNDLIRKHCQPRPNSLLNYRDAKKLVIKNKTTAYHCSFTINKEGSLGVKMFGLEYIEPDEPGDPNWLVVTIEGLLSESDDLTNSGWFYEFQLKNDDFLNDLGIQAKQYSHTPHLKPGDIDSEGETVTASFLKYIDVDDDNTHLYYNRINVACEYNLFRGNTTPIDSIEKNNYINNIMTSVFGDDFKWSDEK